MIGQSAIGFEWLQVVRTNIAEVARTLGAVRYLHVEGVGNTIAPPFLRPEEKCLFLFLVVNAGDIYRTADGIAKIVLLIWWDHAGATGGNAVEVVLSVEQVVAHELIGVAVECAGAALGFDFDGTGSIAAILRAVVRGQHFELCDGIDAGVNVQRAVAAVIHVVAAIEFPVVVLDAAAVHGETDAAIDTDRSFVLSSLVAHAGDQGYKAGEVATVEFELGDFLSGNGAGKFGRLSLDLRDISCLRRPLP